MGQISIGAEEGYQQHVERLLKEIRDTYLGSSRPHPIRVLLSGRPTEAVTQGKLMLDDTRLLTLRYFTPDQLHLFEIQLGHAVESLRIRSKDWVPWTMPKGDVLQTVNSMYAASISFPQSLANDTLEPGRIGGLELMGSPLLGLLALRLARRSILEQFSTEASSISCWVENRHRKKTGRFLHCFQRNNFAVSCAILQKQ